MMRFAKYFLAITYGVFLSYLVFFARRRRNIDERHLNLVPFKGQVQAFLSLDTTSVKAVYTFYSNLGGNVLLFVPLPFVLAWNFRITDSKTVMWTAVGVSFFIELLQYVFKIGVADIDDILLNAAGAAVGIGLRILLQRSAAPA